MVRGNENKRAIIGMSIGHWVVYIKDHSLYILLYILHTHTSYLPVFYTLLLSKLHRKIYYIILYCASRYINILYSTIVIGYFKFIIFMWLVKIFEKLFKYLPNFMRRYSVFISSIYIWVGWHSLKLSKLCSCNRVNIIQIFIYLCFCQ